jgi:hypothetical protein
MKLTPKQVRFIIPFWSGPFRRWHRFSGKRNTVQLQETALVVEGELLRFYYFGLERLFARVLSEWTSVTVPYSRIESVRYRTYLWLRLFILLPIFALATLMMVGLLWEATGTPDAVTMALAASSLLVALFAFVIWRGIGPSYTLEYRAKDGVLTAMYFRVRAVVVRREFDAALAKYRDAARVFDPAGRRS